MIEVPKDLNNESISFQFQKQIKPEDLTFCLRVKLDYIHERVTVFKDDKSGDDFRYYNEKF